MPVTVLHLASQWLPVPLLLLTPTRVAAPIDPVPAEAATNSHRRPPAIGVRPPSTDPAPVRAMAVPRRFRAIYKSVWSGMKSDRLGATVEGIAAR